MRVLKIAVIGVGRMGRLYARIAAELPQTELVAVCGRREAPVAALAQEWGVPGYAGGNSLQMLETHPEIEAVVVATPEWLHLHPALVVTGAGKHLLLEKPLATAVPDARRILAAAEAAGVTFMLCHHLRFDPRFALMKDAVDRGEIGEVRHIYARRNTTMQAAARVAGQIPLTCWISPHDLDMLLWVTGSRVASVSAKSRERPPGPVDHFLATLTFANGVTAVFEQSWVTPPLDGRPRHAVFDVRGTQGSVEVSGNEHGLAIYRPDSAVHPPALEYPIVHGKVFGVFPALVAHFAECVATGRAPLVGGRDGLATVVVAEAIDRAIREGREVVVGE